MGQEKVDSKLLNSPNHSMSRCYFPRLAPSFVMRHPFADQPLFLLRLPHVKKSSSKTFLRELETLSCQGLDVPVFQQFLAVPCFYGVVMVKSESSEDGGSDKELGKELLTSWDCDELEISIAGHQGR